MKHALSLGFFVLHSKHMTWLYRSTSINLSLHYVWYCILVDLNSSIIPQAFTLHSYHWKPFYDLYQVPQWDEARSMTLTSLWKQWCRGLLEDPWQSKRCSGRIASLMLPWRQKMKVKGSQAIGNHPPANEWKWFDFEDDGFENFLRLVSSCLD